MKKKAELAIQYIFLIFVAVIVVFIIIGLVSRWAFKTEKGINVLLDDDGNPIADTQVVEVGDCGDAQAEVEKHAKLCDEKGEQGQIHGTLCYGINMPGCSVNCRLVQTNLATDYGITVNCISDPLQDKAFIEYNYAVQEVTIT